MFHPTEMKQMLAAAATCSNQVTGTTSLAQGDAIQTSRPTTEIEDRLIRASNALVRLSNRVDVISDRLQSVRRVTGTSTPSGSIGVPDEPLSLLGNSIRSIEYQVQSAADRLEALLTDLAL